MSMKPPKYFSQTDFKIAPLSSIAYPNLKTFESQFPLVILKKLARFWKRIEGKKVKCQLCPRFCTIAEGKRGFCRGRENEGGELYTLIYGSITAMGADPIEKKPLYHFWPGSLVFSISSVGCNFKCDFCQNWSLSQTGPENIHHEEVSPEEVVELTKQYGCRGIAFTYNEPTIWWEYCYDVSKLAKRENLYTVYVTNGYMSLEAWQEIEPYIDAANVDVKAFEDGFYKKFAGVPSMEPVIQTCEWFVERGKHLEVTYLIIPGENDDTEEIRNFCRWVVGKLGSEVPVHFSRFFPHYKLLAKPPTPLESLERAYKLARDEGLKYVYLGNVPSTDGENTYCPECGELLIERVGFEILRYRVKGGICPNCGNKIEIRGAFKA